MFIRALCRRLGTLFLPVALLVSCSTIERASFTRAEQASAIIPDIADARFWADAPDTGRRMLPPIAAKGGPFAILALSSGGDDGAYAAGVLNGWTSTGTRPEFAMVTGVSTGALIAPFAFMGSRADGTIAYVYTHLRPSDLYKLRFPLAIFSAPSVATSNPLAGVIAEHVTDALIDAIAAEHRKGRRLFVATTNLDAKRGMVWDMGAIAASEAPDRYALFRRVLLASASLPAFFPPVMIDTQAGGRTIREMHVDGGLMGQFLSVPSRLGTGKSDPAYARATFYLIASSRLGGDFEMAKPHTFSILKRAYAIDLQAALATHISASYLDATARGMAFRLSYIGGDFPQVDHQLFDTRYMRAIYAYGLRHGEAGLWVSRPPDATAPQVGLVKDGEGK